MVTSDPERAWRLTVELLRSAEDPLFRAYVAAGPLEDLLALSGPMFIVRVEDLAKSEAWFREALRSTYGNRMKPEIHQRVELAAK